MQREQAEPARHVYCLFLWVVPLLGDFVRQIVNVNEPIKHKRQSSNQDDE
jgi:hypothetical protein